MGKTSIEWTDHSINPIRARDTKTSAVGHYCEKVSSGCAHCYASNLQKRFRMPAFGGVRTELPEGIEPFLDTEQLEKVLRRKKPTKYFWCDMTDMFGWWVPDEWIVDCIFTMKETPQHTHQILTKRIERAAEFISHWNWDGDSVFPIPNIWIGTSVENQRTADERIPELLNIPAAVRFLSVEPLLGPVDLSPVLWMDCPDCDGSGSLGKLSVPATCETCGGTSDCLGEGRIRLDDTIDWVIVGGESGPGARECNVEWIRSIRDQCRAAGVACFIKQLGALPYMDGSGGERFEWPCGYVVKGMKTWLDLKDSKGGDWDEWPEDLRVREFPQQAEQTHGDD